jgi:hypothetical protein
VQANKTDYYQQILNEATRCEGASELLKRVRNPKITSLALSEAVLGATAIPILCIKCYLAKIWFVGKANNIDKDYLTALRECNVKRGMLETLSVERPFVILTFL